ncbi:glycosyltransferase family 4 protein [Jeotgalicoccus sp. FSL K6-3177]|uniref:glycosyltransferase family 4 protein n=1 Tax=Jeotgalicoccus sp. FSL K6-3177 TaxID=2921494 RepID=UPI0030FDED11
MFKPKVFHIVTVSKSVILMEGQIEFLNNENYDVHLVSSKGKELNEYHPSKVHIVNMKREISLINDLKSLVTMIKLFLKEKPRIINSGTPKAGLIGTLAGFITRRPVRIYTVRGLRLETVTGIKYKILYMMEKIAMFCATDIIAISDSLKDKIIELKLVKENKIEVLGSGSSNGLKLEKFDLNMSDIDSDIKQSIKDKFVIGFVGRITKDKGISELLESFRKVNNQHEESVLLIIGSMEVGDPVSKYDLDFIQDNPNIIHINHVDNPINYYNNMDVLVFPTHREGFGNVSIEAQSLQVPVITYDVTGAKDTVLNGYTGYIVEKNNINAITDKINYFIQNEDARVTFGRNGRKWVFENFSNEIIWKNLLNFYNRRVK